MVLNNTPKRSTRSPGPFTRQQQPSFSLDAVVRKDPKTLGPSSRLTEAWVREQQDNYPATIVKLAEPSEFNIRQNHYQRIDKLKELTHHVDSLRDPAAPHHQQQIWSSSPVNVNGHGREQQANPAAKPTGGGHRASRHAADKRPKLSTNVPVEIFQQQQQQQLTPESPVGWSGMKEFLMTELRREMGLPQHRPHHQDHVDEKSVNLACPLFIRNPAAFTHVRNSCTDGNIKGGIGKLIEHIKRVHLRSDKQCHNCGARYGSKPAESKSSHARSCTKIWSPHEPPLLTEEQHRVLESLSVRASGQSLDYKYRHKLLMKLFPGQEEWAKRVEIYHDSYMPCLLPAQLMFEAMEKAVDRWERGYAAHMYDSDGSDADSDRSRDYRGVSGSSAGASPSTDASSAYPSASSGGYSRALGAGAGVGYGATTYQLSDYADASWEGMEEDMSVATGTTTLVPGATTTTRSSGSRHHKSATADVDFAAAQMQQDYQTYSHAGTVDDFDELGSASYVDHLEPVFDVVSTVPSDYHSYTMDVEQMLPGDYLVDQGHYAKDTINPKDMHNTLIGLGSAAVPRYLMSDEDETGIVLQDTQEYLQGGRRLHR
ncbi:hypothetical protein CSOJ01_11389 [Colletotrichum sojae]|uniref:Uncharacterized protein n=1 Tax=Colletotrichum sojae TaxID=2175907 RepID=A0A8H6IYI7_9PEZI|nr:hypothetical protein CSOJ01_11389 [Colletotrichum sojae]